METVAIKTIPHKLFFVYTIKMILWNGPVALILIRLLKMQMDASYLTVTAAVTDIIYQVFIN